MSITLMTLHYQVFALPVSFNVLELTLTEKYTDNCTTYKYVIFYKIV